jgi:hypothetical protein
MRKRFGGHRSIDTYSRIRVLPNPLTPESAYSRIRLLPNPPYSRIRCSPLLLVRTFGRLTHPVPISFSLNMSPSCIRPGDATPESGYSRIRLRPNPTTPESGSLLPNPIPYSRIWVRHSGTVLHVLNSVIKLLHTARHLCKTIVFTILCILQSC